MLPRSVSQLNSILFECFGEISIPGACTIRHFTMEKYFHTGPNAKCYETVISWQAVPAKSRTYPRKASTQVSKATFRFFEEKDFAFSSMKQH